LASQNQAALVNLRGSDAVELLKRFSMSFLAVEYLSVGMFSRGDVVFLRIIWLFRFFGVSLCALTRIGVLFGV
jgi:hypothetical protein